MSDNADFHDLPLVLVGPSGAGKSSVPMADLLPRLEGAATREVAAYAAAHAFDHWMGFAVARTGIR